MTKKKLAYEAPETESLVVRFEGMVCTSPLQTLGLTIGGADKGFGDSAASIDDKSGESWW